MEWLVFLWVLKDQLSWVTTVDADGWITGSSPLTICYFRTPEAKVTMWEMSHLGKSALRGCGPSPTLQLLKTGHWIILQNFHWISLCLVFLNLDPQTENILNKSWLETAQEPRAPQQSVPAEYFSPDTILFQKYMALICYVKLTLYRNRFFLKKKSNHKGNSLLSLKF